VEEWRRFVHEGRKRTRNDRWEASTLGIPAILHLRMSREALPSSTPLRKRRKKGEERDIEANEPHEAEIVDTKSPSPSPAPRPRDPPRQPSSSSSNSGDGDYSSQSGSEGSNDASSESHGRGASSVHLSPEERAAMALQRIPTCNLFINSLIFVIFMDFIPSFLTRRPLKAARGNSTFSLFFFNHSLSFQAPYRLFLFNIPII